MPISLSWPLRGSLLIAAVLTASLLASSARASVPAELRVVDSDGSILAEQTQYTDTVSLKTDPEATCFGQGTGGSGEKVSVPGSTALGAVVDGTAADGDLKPISVTDFFDFGLGVCGIGDAVSPESGSWYLKHNHAASMTGGDQTTLERGDQVLWYLDPDFADAPPAELELVADARAESGEPLEVQVFEYGEDGKRTPAAGVDVSGAGEPTGADGSTTVSVAAGNTRVRGLKATRSGAISDSDRVCFAADVGDCPKQAGGTIGGSVKDDTIAGSEGPDEIASGRGDDIIDARDGEVDEVDCGGDKDKVKADSEDETARNCEKVRD